MSLTVLAMSGGVDSSVAAKLLLDAGHRVVGVFMRHGHQSPVAACQVASDLLRPVASRALPVVAGAPRLDHKQGCCSASDAEDARRVAEQLEIPFYALDLQQEFARIMDYFVDEYTRGRTPNPCVMCNHWIKFGKLFAYADAIGADYVATGHYARIVATKNDRPLVAAETATGGSSAYPTAGGGEAPSEAQADGSSPFAARRRSDPPAGEPSDAGVRLARGADRRKDQSYALFGIQPQLLRRMLLPVGNYDKTTIRRLAGELGWDVAEKRDSQEICFVTSGKHHEFVGQYRQQPPETSGQIVTSSGQVVGHHQGIERFTVGQRKGLGIALGEPQFVQRIDARTRQVVIGPHHELATYRLLADQANWLVAPPPAGPLRCLVQIRYNSAPVPAQVRILDARRFEVLFDQPCYGVAPGQAAVCYQDDFLLGGGWICQPDR